MIVSLWRIGQEVERLAAEDPDIQDFLKSLVFKSKSDKVVLKEQIKKKEKRIFYPVALKIRLENLSHPASSIRYLEDEEIVDPFSSGFIILQKGGNNPYKISEVWGDKLEEGLDSLISRSLSELLDLYYRGEEEKKNKTIEQLKNLILEEVSSRLEKAKQNNPEYNFKVKLYIGLEGPQEYLEKVAKRLFEPTDEDIFCAVCGKRGKRSNYSLNELIKFFVYDKVGYLGRSFAPFNRTLPRKKRFQKWLSNTFPTCVYCTKYIIIGWRACAKRDLYLGKDKSVIIKFLPSYSLSSKHIELYVRWLFLTETKKEDIKNVLFDQDRLSDMLEEVEKRGEPFIVHILFLKNSSGDEMKILYTIESEFLYLSRLYGRFHTEKLAFTGKVGELYDYLYLLRIIFLSQGKNKVLAPYGDLNFFKLLEFILNPFNKSVSVADLYFHNLIVRFLPLFSLSSNEVNALDYAKKTLYWNFPSLCKAFNLVLETKNVGGGFMENNKWYEWAYTAGQVFRCAVDVQDAGGDYGSRGSVPPLLRKFTRSLFGVDDIYRYMVEANKVVNRYRHLQECKSQVERFEKKMSWLDKLRKEAEETSPPKDKSKLSYYFVSGYYSLRNLSGGEQNE